MLFLNTNGIPIDAGLWCDFKFIASIKSNEFLVISPKDRITNYESPWSHGKYDERESQHERSRVFAALRCHKKHLAENKAWSKNNMKHSNNNS